MDVLSTSLISVLGLSHLSLLCACAMAEAAAGQALGPRPGISILTFFQGIVEIGLRAAAIVSFM